LILGLALLVLSICKEGPAANLLFGNPVDLWLGNISFSLYLSH
jgi:peptidoglycan/LPS O-acetylase OafA/YrhL